MTLDLQGQIILAGQAGAGFFAYARFDTAHPDYAVSAPSTLIAPIGESTATTVAINSIEGFTGDVTLTLSGGPNGEPLPAGLKVSFNGVDGDTTTLQVPADGTASTTMAITVMPTVPP